VNRGLIFLFFVVYFPPGIAEPGSIRQERHVAEIGDEVFVLHVPFGYSLELLTTDMQRPRLFTFDQKGNMLVGSRSGHVYKIKPPYTRPEFILILSDYPHSLALRGEYLYIAQTSGLFRIPYQPDVTELDEGDMELVAKIPGGWGHNSRSLKVGADGRLYVSLGITGNCSDEYLDDSYPANDRRGGVMVLDESVQPAQWKAWASGLRNPVGFDWHPKTGVMYASNNGPDHLGYDQPPEALARLERGSFHGMPWYQFDGRRINRDPCIKSNPPRTDVTRPVATFPARNAPMDVHFINDGHLDRQFHGDAIVALHGSWGTKPDGGSSGHPSSRRPPALVLVRFEQGVAVRVDDFVTGFQNQKGERFARPMGLGTGPDGALYMTSDGGINGLFRLSPK
jgi:glucose/arabinose dehydrogenase